jgi:hypothetical protein
MSKRPRGPLPNWEPSTERQAAILADIVVQYNALHADDLLPRGGRGIFYDLRPNGHGNGMAYRKPDSQHPKSEIVGGKRVRLFGPMEAAPEDVQEVLALARRAGKVPEHWVADGRAVAPTGNDYDESAEDEADSVARRIANAARWFELDPQRGQPVYIEVLCEAADLVPRVARIANPYGVWVYPSSGFDGLKGKRAFADRAMDRDKPTVVLHIGDRDDHGDHIYVAAGEDAVAWADDSREVKPVGWLTNWNQLAMFRRLATGTSPGLTFIRLGLTTAQATTLGILDADGKAEADAVPVATMDGWITDAIEALQDPARRDELLAEEEAERERLPGLIRQRMEGE